MATFQTINRDILRLVYRLADNPDPATFAELERLVRRPLQPRPHLAAVRAINDRKRRARIHLQTACDEVHRAYWRGRYEAHRDDRDLVETMTPQYAEAVP